MVLAATGTQDFRGNAAMAHVKPTTKAQISGHRFLRRRVEHGLVMGDVRMLHDPMAQRRRALLAGTGMSVLIAAGAGLMAWLQPNPDPGEAPIVRTAQGQTLVRVDGVLHPVPNLVSAQLIAGAPELPAAIGPDELRASTLGAPVGLADAPGFLDPQPEGRAWATCRADELGDAPDFATQWATDTARQTIIVHADLTVRPLEPGQAALVEAEGRRWMLTAQGRRRLPEGALGQVIERALGIGPDTERRAVPPEFLSTFEELPEYAAPPELPVVWESEGRTWARTGEGVTPLTRTQAEALVALGARHESAEPELVAQLADAAVTVRLPEEPARWLQGSAEWLCAVDGGAATADPVGGLVPLAGDSVATHFGGLDTGGVAVDTGHGRVVVSATGTRHAVAGTAEWEALGLESPRTAPWPVLRLLPEGSELTRDAALQTHKR